MTRHSKNNTSASVFSYSERSKLAYGTIERRHTRDTVKKFDACYLCFLTAIDPVCCSEGHLSCRECIISTLLSQKNSSKELANKKAALEKRAAELDAEEARKDALQKEQMFIRATEGKINPQRTDSSGMANALALSSSCSFWIPEKAPNFSLLEGGKALKAPPSKTSCFGGFSPHSITLRSLITLNFTAKISSSSSSSSSSSDEEKICPICLRSLNNNFQLLVFKSCGHVLCNECVHLSTPEQKKCIACGEDSSQLIRLSKDGTGFASGGGQVLIRKYDLPFQ
ncbi:hypothetical protein MDAP_001223 [Mitosporidium daphniae]